MPLGDRCTLLAEAPETQQMPLFGDRASRRHEGTENSPFVPYFSLFEKHFARSAFDDFRENVFKTVDGFYMFNSSHDSSNNAANWEIPDYDVIVHGAKSAALMSRICIPNNIKQYCDRSRRHRTSELGCLSPY
jgi:hypothetical protein